MNREVKKRYQDSKKKLQERAFELEKEFYELKTRMKLIADISNQQMTKSNIGQRIEEIIKELDQEGLRLVIPIKKKYEVSIIRKSDYDKIVEDSESFAEERREEILKRKEELDEWDPNDDNVDQDNDAIDEAIQKHLNLKNIPTSHIDELKKHQAEGMLKPSEIKKKKINQKQHDGKRI